MRTVSVVMTQKMMVHRESVEGDSKMTVDMPDYCGWAARPVIAALIINVLNFVVLATWRAWFGASLSEIVLRIVWKCDGMMVCMTVVAIASLLL